MKEGRAPYSILVAARLPIEIEREINRHASESGKTKAAVIREWIFEGFNRMEQEDQGNKKAA